MEQNRLSYGFKNKSRDSAFGTTDKVIAGHGTFLY